MRTPRDFRDIHAAADSFEPRFAKAFIKAMDRARARVSIYDLAHALGAKDVKRAMALVKGARLKDALVPVAGIVKDARAKGKRLGVAMVKRAL